MEKWMVSAKKADFNAIAKTFGIDPVIARLIRNRDIMGEEAIKAYLHGTLSDIPSPHLLKDIDKAALILEDKIRAGARIRILGDYDIDGVTATFILKKALKRLGARVDAYIPDRILDGYGIHEPLVRKAVSDGIDTLLTCDNGIAARGEIGLAKDNGMTVIVTDHHEIPFTEENGTKTYILPPADAIVDPKQPDCPYPFEGICGAVVAFKLMQVLYGRMGEDAGLLEEFVEIAAIATVGDVMDLAGENRILVKEGLRRLNETKNTGLRALIAACGLGEKPMTSYHIGFVIGPCINASGRLKTAEKALALLECEDAEKAAILAEELRELNEERKRLTDEAREEAYRLIDETPLKEDRVLVVFLPSCHESIAGIVAGRIREKYNKPVFVLTRGEKSAKGSGRSIESYSMYEEMNRCSHLLIQFGGHPMAAGLSIREEDIDAFRKELNDNCRLTEEDLTEKILIDVPMPLSYVTKELIRQLALLEPFGKGNPKPVFACRNVHLFDERVVGSARRTLKMKLRDENGRSFEAVYFGDPMEMLAFLEGRDTVNITYYPEINTWNHVENIQFVITNVC